jgi:uncharacterized protein (TIGR00661 family)
MNILFAIQATGNGHLSRAREFIPYLRQYGSVDLLVSGTQADVHLPYLIKYKKHGISFTFGKAGGINVADTIKQLRPFTFFKDIYSFPVQNYDLVINDFEPVTAWACRIKQKACVALSHQSAYLSKKVPRPEKKNPFAEAILKHYAPCTWAIGFHFNSFDSFIHTPVIRADIRKKEVSNQGHITVYLPAHSDTLLVKNLIRIKDVKWEVFSKHSTKEYRVQNVFVSPISNMGFTKSVVSSNGLLTAAGFEGPSEALFLGKKVLSIPMHGQYEQQCNGEALKKIGVEVIDKIDHNFAYRLLNWLENKKTIALNYPDETGQIVAKLIEEKKFFEPKKETPSVVN